MQVGMDLVGLLPKSIYDHEYILVIVNYATRYPKVSSPKSYIQDQGN